MRIPISKSDLDAGRFTKISRALQKVWPGADLGLMQSQNIVASLFGYRNLHDLQANVITIVDGPANLSTRWSRTGICNAVAWRLFRQHGTNLSRANEIASKLHLNTLAIDVLTMEAVSERARKEDFKNGRFYFQDEFGMWPENPNWHPKAPQILDAQVPGYSFAVLPDRRVFHWSLLKEILEQLPADFLDNLCEERQYATLPRDAVEQAFIFTELFPQACESLFDTAKVRKTLPEGVSIEWIFSGDGQCLGRVLNNKSLGGIIPIVYGIEDDDIYHAIGRLLTGEVLTPPEIRPNSNDIALYSLRYCLGGHDFAKDVGFCIEPGSNALLPRQQDLTQFPAHMKCRVLDGAAILVGGTFMEQGQVYLRNQQWMSLEDIPEIVLKKCHIKSSVVAQSECQYLKSNEVVPDAAAMLYQTAKDALTSLFNEADSGLQTTDGVAALNALLLSITDAASFGTYCDGLIDGDLPVRHESDAEDDNDFIEERNREIARLERNGQQIKETIPALSAFKDSSLGMMLLLLNDEYPGSRSSGWVYPPKKGSPEEIVHFLSGLLLHAVCHEGAKVPPNPTFSKKVLALVVNRVIEGKTPLQSMPAECAIIAAFCKKLESHEQFVKRIQSWQQKEDQVRSIRAEEKFLYVGSPVEREKPKGLAEIFSLARSHNFSTVLVEQNANDFFNAPVDQETEDSSDAPKA